MWQAINNLTYDAILIAVETLNMSDLIGRVQRCETRLWSLIDAQEELHALIVMVRHRKDVALHILDLLEVTMQQCEANTWALVPFHLKLRLTVLGKGVTTTPATEVDSCLMDTKDDMLPEDFFRVSSENADDSPAEDESNESVRQISILDTSARRKSSSRSNRPIVCSKCNRSLTTYRRLEQHQRSCRGVRRIKLTDTELICRFCKQQFDTPRSLRSHFERRHPGEQPFACGICDRNFLSLLVLETHRDREHRNAPKFTCEHCDKSFRANYQLKQHAKVHEERRFECDICGLSLRSLDGIKLHMKRIHSSNQFKMPTTHLCPICGQAFNGATRLDTHMRVHNNDKPFACTQCDYRTSYKNNLSRHILRHRNDRSFECCECRKSFNSNEALKKHKKIVHPAELLFVCAICGKKFATKEYLGIHFRAMHSNDTPFACSECGERFSSYKNRGMHMKSVHAEELPLQCDVCYERFSKAVHLSAHMVKHTGRRLFVCSQCEQRFGTANELITHQQLTHS